MILNLLSIQCIDYTGLKIDSIIIDIPKKNESFSFKL